jgi:arylsulfatase A-like enzyme
MGYVDVMPTLLEIAGVKTRPQNPLDGISMFPVFTGKTENIKRSLFLGSGAIVNSDWKLIEGPSPNPKMKFREDQFFHISSDPIEKNNIKDPTSKEYNQLKKEIVQYNEIKASTTVPPYEAGRPGFVAPKEWTIKD